MKHSLYSIGYGNRKTENFLALLKVYKIDCLVDIRTKPQSRFNPGYNRGRLQSFLLENGISYLFMGDSLGGMPKDPLCYKNGEIDYSLVWQMPFYKQGISELIATVESGLNVCIMCCELNADQCHRKNMVGAYLSSEHDIETRHIDKMGAIQ